MCSPLHFGTDGSCLTEQPEQEAPWERWWRYAKEDLATARPVAESGGAHRWTCMLAQQAAEKAVKALLIRSGTNFRALMTSPGWCVCFRLTYSQSKRKNSIACRRVGRGGPLSR